MPDARSWCLHGAMEMILECNARDNVVAVPDMDWSRRIQVVYLTIKWSIGSLPQKVETSVSNVVNR